MAVKFKKDVSVIEKWESGEDFPTYSQLEKLAEIYKRPLALFFFPEPPLEAEEKQEFRTLPDFEIENLAADTIYALRQAKASSSFSSFNYQHRRQWLSHNSPLR